jgi:hypothetical protein
MRADKDKGRPAAFQAEDRGVRLSLPAPVILGKMVEMSISSLFLNKSSMKYLWCSHIGSYYIECDIIRETVLDNE